MFYELEEIENVLGGLEERLGISLSRIYVTAHKRAISMFVETELTGLQGRLARKLVSRIIYLRTIQLVNWCGLGRVRLKGYRKGKWFEVEVTDIWSKKFFPGDIAGAWIAVEGKDCSVELREEGDSHVCRAEALYELDDTFAERLHPPTGMLLGTKDYPRCRVCGAPDDFKCYKWDKKKGFITEKDTGIRVAHNTVGCVNTALFEIRQELGEELLDIVIRIEADFIQKSVAGGKYEGDREPGWIEKAGKKEVYSHYLGFIKRRCMGNPQSISCENGTLKLSVRNPANEELVLGRILGIYQAVEGVPGRVEWQVVNSILEAKVTPTP